MSSAVQVAALSKIRGSQWHVCVAVTLWSSTVERLNSAAGTEYCGFRYL